MNDFSPDKWERIKRFAARLQAIKNILEFFDGELENQYLAEELNPVKEQLEADFEQTLGALLELIDDEDTNIN